MAGNLAGAKPPDHADGLAPAERYDDEIAGHQREPLDQIVVAARERQRQQDGKGVWHGLHSSPSSLIRLR